MITTKFPGLRLISAFGILLLLGVWLFVWSQTIFEYNRELEDASREGMNLARVYEDHVRRVLQDVDRDLLALRGAYVQDGFSGQALRTLADRVSKDPSRAQIGIADEHGIFRSLLTESAIPFSSLDRDYFTVHREPATDTMYVGRTIFGRHSNQVVLPVSRRINKPDGSFGGIVSIAIRADYFLESFKSIELGPENMISIVGMDGFNRVTQGMNSKDPGIDVSQDDMFRSSLLQPQGTIRMVSMNDGIKRIYNYRVLPEYGVYISVGIAEQDILQDFIEYKKAYFGAATLITLFVIGFCGIWQLRNLTQRELKNRIKADANNLRTLQETTSRLLTESADIDTLLQVIQKDAMRLAGAPGGFIALVDATGDTWTIRYEAGIDEARLGERNSIPEGLIGEVISCGQLLYVEDYARYSRRLFKRGLNSVKSLLCLPLLARGEIIGVLSIQWEDIRFESSGRRRNQGAVPAGHRFSL